ncbi:hypothetical protein CJD44_21280 [Streptomyces sp. alain-838]|nr:hypothetical protein CJD44_21280 [Streptomyces sp. alain-838]
MKNDRRLQWWEVPCRLASVHLVHDGSVQSGPHLVPSLTEQSFMRQLIRLLLGSDDPFQLRQFPALAFFPPIAQPPHADIRQRTNPTNQMEDSAGTAIQPRARRLVEGDQRRHRLRRGGYGGRPSGFARETYRRRSVIERCFNRLS